MQDLKAFFDAVRGTLFGGSLSTGQVAGCQAIIKAFQDRGLTDTRWLAYCLATAYHETARTMQPIKEWGGPAYFRRMYDPLSDDPGRAALALRMGAEPGDGVQFYGRGYVQLTWRANYEKLGRLLEIDLVGHPDLALQPGTAAAIMLEGMERGLFTGKKLGDYFGEDGRCDWVNARRIINGTDRAADVAGYAQRFNSALGG
jgi:putative chitinase